MFVDPDEKSPSVSVAMCTYNGSRFLREQLASVETQTKLPDELVVCDDGSTDATADILSDFAGAAPFTVRFIQNKLRLGSTRNFEKALTLCRGRFIALADQDDIWNPHKLATLSAFLESNPDAGGVFSDAALIDVNSDRTGGCLWKTKSFSPQRDALSPEQMIDVLLKQNVVTGATMMIRADSLNRLLPVGASWIHDGWIAWMLVLYSRLEFLRTPLTYYRLHDSQQVGAASSSIAETLAKGRSTGSTHFVNVAQQFEVLRAHWDALPGSHFARRRLQFDGKIRHMYMRAQLPHNPLARLPAILSSSRDYMNYSRGLSSMIRDLVI
ncbi:MAG: glycosyltransferase family 2 protein [Acidobacteriota bacterium]|nr:glycosyltransferase family 2 protein [Acidobacteriota bacterium]